MIVTVVRGSWFAVNTPKIMNDMTEGEKRAIRYIVKAHLVQGGADELYDHRHMSALEAASANYSLGAWALIDHLGSSYNNYAIELMKTYHAAKNRQDFSIFSEEERKMFKQYQNEHKEDTYNETDKEHFWAVSCHMKGGEGTSHVLITLRANSKSEAEGRAVSRSLKEKPDMGVVSVLSQKVVSHVD